MATNTINDLTQTTSINNNDLFVLSQQDRYIHDQYNNESITGKNLADVLIAKILQDSSLKDTIYHESSDFSPVEHHHDDKYNKVDIDFLYDIKDTSRAMLSIGNMFFDGTLSTVAIPQSALQTIFTVPFTIVEPAVGTLKFVAKNNIGTNASIDYKSDDFDGWLYPNGDIFNLVDFSLSNTLNLLYGNDDNRTFTLPNLRNFLKYNSSIDGNSLIADVPAQVVLPYHTHSVNMQLTGMAYIQLSVRVGDQAGNTPRSDPYNMCHDGNGKLNASDKILEYEKKLSTEDLNKFRQNDTLKMKTLTLTINKPLIFSNSVEIYNNDPENGETYPSHVILPVMIYVGQKKRRLI